MSGGRFLLPPQLVASSILEAGRITAGRQAEEERRGVPLGLGVSLGGPLGQH